MRQAAPDRLAATQVTGTRRAAAVVSVVAVARVVGIRRVAAPERVAVVVLRRALVAWQVVGRAAVAQVAAWLGRMVLALWATPVARVVLARWVTPAARACKGRRGLRSQPALVTTLPVLRMRLPVAERWLPRSVSRTQHRLRERP